MQIGHHHLSGTASSLTGKLEVSASNSLATVAPASRQTDFSLSQSSDAVAADSSFSPVTATSTAQPSARRSADQSNSSDDKAVKPDKDSSQTTENAKARGSASELTDEELAMIEQLSARDQEVRAHERAHQAVAGPYAGSASYSYQSGPDGKRYAIGGEVPIDVSPIPGDPRATIAKMQTVKAAAMAPAEPSSQDRRVAASASQAMMDAQQQLAELNRVASSEEKISSTIRVKANEGVRDYTEISGMDETSEKHSALIDAEV